jgi:hypothetical protein
MSEIEDRNEMSDFIKKRRAKNSFVKPVSVEPVSAKPIPWYKRPLGKEEFSHKLAKNGRYYVRHNEWSSHVWIGPYRNMEDVKSIIDSYVVESLKNDLSKKYDENIHSVIIDNPEEFF